MQNKRRILKRLIKEVLSEDKRFLINESWKEIEKYTDKQDSYNLYDTLEREGFKQLANKIKAKKGLVFDELLGASTYVISLLDKNSIQTFYVKKDRFRIYLINKKNNEHGVLDSNGWLTQYRINGDYVDKIDTDFINFDNVIEKKPKVITDKYWGMKALHLKPKGDFLKFIIIYQ